MALPSFSACAYRRPRVLAGHLVRQREQQARWRHQWELHAQYFREQNVRGQRHAVWSSPQSYDQSMMAFHNLRLKDEKKASLEQRRNRLRTMLREEQDRLEAELKELSPDSSTLASQLVQKTEELSTLREQRRKKLAKEQLKEHWRKNNPQLREFGSALHKDHVVSHWQEQMSEKKEQEVAEQQEKRRFENEYERTRKEALERIKQAEEQKKAEDRKMAEELRKQMEELKLREEEATRLKKEQAALLAQQRELEKIEDERRKVEERKKKSEMRRFLIRQYRAQLRRRAQQVQEELEADRKILEALLEGEEEDRMVESARRERAIADAALMKRVIEEQLHFEREREAEIDHIHRQEAQRVWEKREAQWENERKARERLMNEVLAGRQKQLELKIQRNREAQEESLKRREELIQDLETDREYRRQEREQEEGRKKAWVKEVEAQVEQKQQEQWEEQCRIEQEEEEDKELKQIEEEELRQEMEMMAKKGYQERSHSRPRSAWT